MKLSTNLSTHPLSKQSESAPSPHSELPKAVLVRLDKIGDLICTLGVDQSLGQYQVRWVVAKGMENLLTYTNPSRAAHALFLDKSAAWYAFFVLLKYLLHEKPEVFCSFQSSWWVNFAAFLARVPQRTGVKSQWHSFVFLNRGLRQKRSLAEMHESQYNQEIINSLMGQQHLYQAVTMALPEPCPKSAAAVAATQPLVHSPFVIVHPGMAGSARNWSTAKFCEMIAKLLKDYPSLQIALTGTAMDSKYVDPVAENFAGEPRVVNLKGSLSFLDLLDLIKQSRFVIAPSTGVLHLAASLDQPCLGIYSPVRVQRAVRWGPMGSQAQSLSPPINCPAQKKCWGNKCQIFDCMDIITVESVVEKVKTHLENV